MNNLPTRVNMLSSAPPDVTLSVGRGASRSIYLHDEAASLVVAFARSLDLYLCAHALELFLDLVDPDTRR